MSLGFYLLSLAFAGFWGHALSSQGRFFSSNFGQLALLLMGIGLLGPIGWAIWNDTWLAGIIEVGVIAVGVFLGRMIAQSLHSW